MNLFVLDKDPLKAAMYQHNKHVIRMTSETAQIITNIIRVKHSNISCFTEYLDSHKPDMSLLCKLYNPNHIAVRWASSNLENFYWTVNLLESLLMEYDYRYGKPNKFKKARYILTYCKLFIHARPILYGGLTKIKKPTQFCFIGPDIYLYPGDIIKSYREYYIAEKLPNKKYTKREIPKWALK